MSKKSWTDELLSELKDLYAKGVSYDEMATTFSTTVSAVNKVLHRHKLRSSKAHRKLVQHQSKDAAIANADDRIAQGLPLESLEDFLDWVNSRKVITEIDQASAHCAPADRKLHVNYVGENQQLRRVLLNKPVLSARDLLKKINRTLATETTTPITVNGISYF